MFFGDKMDNSVDPDQMLPANSPEPLLLADAQRTKISSTGS